MAQGSIVVFNEAKENLINLAVPTAIKIMLITTLPTPADLTPDSSNYTQVADGGGYLAPGETSVMTVVEAAGTVTVDLGDVAWTSAGAGDPTNIVAALVYTTDAVAEDAIGYIDMTVDGGTTPVSLLSGNINLNFPTGFYTLA